MNGLTLIIWVRKLMPCTESLKFKSWRSVRLTDCSDFFLCVRPHFSCSRLFAKGTALSSHFTLTFSEEGGLYLLCQSLLLPRMHIHWADGEGQMSVPRNEWGPAQDWTTSKWQDGTGPRSSSLSPSATLPMWVQQSWDRDCSVHREVTSHFFQRLGSSEIVPLTKGKWLPIFLKLNWGNSTLGWQLEEHHPIFWMNKVISHIWAT